MYDVKERYYEKLKRLFFGGCFEMMELCESEEMKNKKLKTVLSLPCAVLGITY